MLKFKTKGSIDISVSNSLQVQGKEQEINYALFVHLIHPCLTADIAYY